MTVTSLRQWSPTAGWRQVRRRLLCLLPVNVALSIWYFTWLLAPERIGNPVLYGLLIVAESFNLVQAAGFWWTASKAKEPPPTRTDFGPVPVDVLIPVYNEELDVVEATVAAACRLAYPEVTVVVCDDGDRDELAAMAVRHGAEYIRRSDHSGAKAGNLNHALLRTSSPFIAVFDCDHVPAPSFLGATMGHFSDPNVALVQTPQHYANAADNPIAAAAWSQQALFFGVIARGKDAMGSMFCCGTNVVIRREALESVGGIPEDSVTEDFELSVRLRERGWRIAYVPTVLASGLGPEDMASYVSQQHRWARGCLAAVATVARSRLPWRQRAQFLLSSMFFLTGWTYLIYMTLPVVRILGGQQALAGATANQFLDHFAPYFCFSMLTVAIAGRGSYTFSAFALMEASFWIHISASIRALLRRRSRFVVTPKVGKAGRQPGAVAPALVALSVLIVSAVYGLIHSRSPATLNNVAFADLHISVLLVGIWPALVGTRSSRVRSPDLRLERAAA
ncbi:MAG TPA: glycosyltransferase [Acidimicrobiales bacterium]|nr:glycosyltransferase [Acidimicrobiales bacterium]